MTASRSKRISRNATLADTRPEVKINGQVVARGVWKRAVYVLVPRRQPTPKIEVSEDEKPSTHSTRSQTIPASPERKPQRKIKKEEQDAEIDWSAASPWTQMIQSRINLPVVADLSEEVIGGQAATFTRLQISRALGGSTQCTIVRNTKPKTHTGPAVPFLLCVKRNWNPLAPSKPGQHGIIFLGRVDVHTFDLTPPYGGIYFDYRGEKRLCQTPSDGVPIFLFHKANEWIYYGHYRLHQSTPMTGKEWSHLPRWSKRIWYKRAQKRVDFADTVRGVLELSSKDFSEAQFDVAMQRGAQRLNAVVVEFMKYRTDFVDRIHGRGAIDTKEETVKKEEIWESPSLSNLSEISDDDSIATLPKVKEEVVAPIGLRKSQRRSPSQ